jgi:hypothetical protein
MHPVRLALEIESAAWLGETSATPSLSDLLYWQPFLIGKSGRRQLASDP